MIIAMPTIGKDLESLVSSSFGRSTYFIFVKSETMEFQVVENVSANAQGGAGISAAQTIIDNGSDILITPHLGQNAANVLKNGDIKLMKAVPKTIKELVVMYKNDQLDELTEIHPGHHGGHR